MYVGWLKVVNILRHIGVLRKTNKRQTMGGFGLDLDLLAFDTKDYTQNFPVTNRHTYHHTGIVHCFFE